MFNRRISDDLAAIQEIEDRAVSRARVPGVETIGNAAGAYRVVTSGLVPADPNEPPVVGAPNGDSGTDIDGNEFYPFILGVDTPDDIGAYVFFSSATRNYIN